jgi:hypothetical protein
MANRPSAVLAASRRPLFHTAKPAARAACRLALGLHQPSQQRAVAFSGRGVAGIGSHPIPVEIDGLDQLPDVLESWGTSSKPSELDVQRTLDCHAVWVGRGVAIRRLSGQGEMTETCHRLRAVDRQALTAVGRASDS